MQKRQTRGKRTKSRRTWYKLCLKRRGYIFESATFFYYALIVDPPLIETSTCESIAPRGCITMLFVSKLEYGETINYFSCKIHVSYHCIFEFHRRLLVVVEDFIKCQDINLGGSRVIYITYVLAKCARFTTFTDLYIELSLFGR